MGSWGEITGNFASIVEGKLTENMLIEMFLDTARHSLYRNYHLDHYGELPTGIYRLMVEGLGVEFEITQ